MSSRRGSRFPLNAVLLLYALAGTAYAADWSLSDSLGFSLNALTRDNETGKDTNRFYSRLTPSLNLRGKMHGRVQGQVGYSLNAALNSGDNTADSSSISHKLKANAKAELYEDMIFLGASANAGTAIRSDSDNYDSDTGLLDGIQTYSFQLSPELRHHLGRYVDIVSRNSINYSGSDSNDKSDNWSSRLHVGVQNGRAFGPLSWSIDYSRRTRYLEEGDNTAQSYDANVSYRLNRRWSLAGGIGYSTSDAQTRRDDNSAANWNVGASWTPNQRTRASANFGQNYSGHIWDASFSHVTKRTRIQASYSRSLTNADTVQDELLEPGINPDGTPVEDPVTGLPLEEPTIIFVPTDENFIRTRVGSSVTLTGRRTSVVGSLQYSERQYDVSGNSDESASFRLSANRTLAERLSVSASAGINDYSSSSADSNTSYNMRLGVNKRLGRRSSISASLNHRVFENDSDTGYSEQRFSLTFRTSFL